MSVVSVESSVAACLSDGLDLGQSLLRVAAERPAIGMVHVAEDGAETFDTYSALVERAAATLAGLRTLGLQPGDKVVLQIRSSRDFVAAYWACQLGGLVPAPLPVPSAYHEDDPECRQFLGVLDLLEAPLVVADGGLMRELLELGRQRPGLRATAFEGLLEHGSAGSFHRGDPNDTAFIMFSSGSTAAPKGVLLTHANVLHNALQIVERSATSSHDVSLNWLPFTHDMGLILFHLTAVLAGLQQVKLGSLTFIRRPELYLDALQRHRATLTGSPNFGLYHLLHAFQAEELRRYDLSSVRILYNGAEPISPRLCREFADAFAATKLSPDVILAGYGLAEASVTAAGYPFAAPRSPRACPAVRLDRRALLERHLAVSRPDGPEDETIEFADLGPPMAGMEFRVVDDQGRPLPERSVAHLQMRGPNVSPGYYRNAEADRERHLPGGWLSSGDLGFMLDGHVFITGREKDVVFINGRNVYAHDVEEAIVRAGELRLGQVAVVGYNDPELGRERVAVFVASRRKPEACLPLLQAVREVVRQRFHFEVDWVLPVRQIPRTSSGKLRRYALAEEILAGRRRELIEEVEGLLARTRPVAPARNGLDQQLVALCARRFDVPVSAVGIDDTFVELGGDSLGVLGLIDDLQACAHPALQRVTPAQLYRLGTIRRLSDALEAGDEDGDDAALVRLEGDLFPLSPVQKQLWFLYRLDPRDTSYNETHTCELRPDLDWPAFESAVRDVVARHAGLRTVFGERDGVPWQRVQAEARIALDVDDVDAPDVAAYDRSVAARVSALAQQPFDLEAAPPVRLRVLRGAGRLTLAISIHHILIDGWGFRVLFRDLATAYAARRQGQALGQDEAPVRPVDYFGWLATRQGTAHADAARAYWRALLARPAPVLALPARREPAPPDTPAVAHSHERLAAERLHRLQRAARTRGYTLYHYCTAAYLLLLSRVAEAGDILVGTTVSGRVHPQSRDLLAYLSATAALRVDLLGCVTARDVLERVKEQAQRLLEYQAYPADLTRAAGGPHGDAPRAPYTAAFTMMEAAFETPADGPFSGAQAALPTAAKLDLLLAVEQAQDGLNFTWEFNPRRLDAAAVERWQADYLLLLERLERDPEFSLATVRLLTPAQRAAAQILAPRPSAPPRHLTVTDFLDEASRAYGPRIALSDDRRQLTYAELDGAARRLAGHLQARGAGRDTRVAVWLPKSVDMVVAALAAVRAGAAYVPLDADLPAARVIEILGRGRVRHVLTLAAQADELRGQPGLPDGLEWLDVDALAATAAPALADVAASPEDPIYLHFTSGSTGVPKGVVNSHRSVCHLIDWYLQSGLYGAAERIPQLPPFAFEASAGEIFPGLAAGAHLRVFPSLKTTLPESVLDGLIEFGTSVLTVSPSYFLRLARLLDERRRERWSALRTVVFGGEALLPEQARLFRRCLGEQVTLINAYGPTEASVHSTASTLPAREADLAPDALPIGTPILHRRVFVLDPLGRLCEPGTPGEIAIGGEGLASGYFDDPQGTARVFVELPLGGPRPERVYRTGDMAVQREDGQLVFRGRCDSQVKIRGNRVELLEVESVLSRHPDLREVAVVARESASGGVLVAFYTSPERAVPPAELTEFAGRTLPTYMVPSRFRQLEALPRSSNEKVDRQALLALCESLVPTAAAASGPRTEPPAAGELAASVAAVWAQVLGVPAIGADDNFFGSGGDSILSLEVVSKLRQLGHDVAPADMFKHQTPGALAACIAARRASVEAAPALPRAVGVVGLTPIQAWFFENRLAHPNRWLQSLEIDIRGGLEVERLQRAVAGLVDHHDMLRAVFRRTPAGLTQIVRERLPELPFESVDLRGAEADALRAFSTRVRGRAALDRVLFAVGVAQLAADHHRVIWAAHHLVVDTVSWRILGEDLARAYECLGQGRAFEPPARTVSYQAHSQHLTAVAEWETHRASLEQEFAFWRPWLEGHGGALRLAPELDVRELPLASYGSASVALDQGLTRQLLGEANRRYATRVQDLLAAALARGLARWSGQTQIACDVEAHGRGLDGEGLDVSRTVGWFTALHPLVLSVPPAQSVGDSIVAAKEARFRTAKPGASFGVLRYLCTSPEVGEAFAGYRDPDVAFNYLGQVDRLTLGEGWSLAAPSSEDFDPRDHAPYKLIVQAATRADQLVWELSCSTRVLSAEALSTLAHTVIEELEAVLRHAAEPARRTFTPSDFPLAALEAADVARLPEDTQDAYPPTPMQEGMIFYCLSHPEAALYHEQTVYAYERALDPQRLNEAWARLIARHDILRVAYIVEGVSRPLQVVLAPRPFQVQVEDLSALPADEQRRAVEDWLERERDERRFDLTSWPLFRCALFRRGPLAWDVVFSFHHALLDGWSQSRLISELFECYETLEQAPPGAVVPAPAPLASRFADYVERALAYAADPEARDFWQQRLSAPPSNELPADIARTGVRRATARNEQFQLSEELTRRLEALARRLKVTLNEVCLAAYAYLLHTLSGDSDIVTGVVTSGRLVDLPDGDQLLGCFLNTFPLRVTFDEEQASFEDLVGLTHEFLLAAKPYEYFPLRQIQRLTAGSAREPGAPREMFSNIYAFENYPTRARSERGLTMVGGYDMTNYDLTTVVVNDGRLRVMFEYAPDVYRAETMRRWLAQYVNLLDVLSARPDTCIQELDLLPAEQQALFVRYNERAVPYETDVVLHELIYRQAAKNPERVAVSCEGRTLSYAQLNRDSNRLARALRAHGAAPGGLVCCLVHRDCGAVAALTGVLKSGAAYVPIDPEYPLERIALIVRDCQSEVLVTDAALLASGKLTPQSFPSVRAVVCIDEPPAGAGLGTVRVVPRSEWEAEDDADLARYACPEDLAYIIFTSGSTGRPKGVVIRHANIVNTVFGINELYGVNAADKVLCFSSFSFDLSVYDLFGTLAAGAEVVLASEEQIRSTERLMDLIEERGVTLWDSVPTGMNQLVKTVKLAGERPPNHTLRLVMLSGEFIPLTLRAEIRELFPEARVSSLGGATEGTVWSIYYFPVEELDPAWKSIPYGWPLPNQGYYVLNSRMRRCLVDQPGMLYIVGKGVAAGYFRDPEKTAAAFVRDPFSSEPESIIYKTGDLGRMRGDGHIEIIGRKDAQVKVRGFRIELGEVENQLGLHPDLEEVAALALPDPAGHKRLVACYTARRAEVTLDDLVQFLKTKLPEYMIPSQFHRLERMPVNSSGKLDRKALTELVENATRPDLGTPYVEPATPLEQTIAKVFADVLRVERVGAHDNYFSLGGDSILSLQVAARLSQSGLRIRPSQLFRQPTVAELARYLEANQDIPDTAAADSPVVGEVALGPIQDWFFRLGLPDPHGWLLSMDVEIREEVDAELLRRALLAVVNHHDLLRARFEQGEPQSTEDGLGVRQIIGPALETLELPVVDLSDLDEATQSARLFEVGQQTRRAVRLDQPPLTRATLVRRGPARYHLVWAAHHLVVDRVSWQVLLEDLPQSYKHLRDGQEPALLPRTSSYAAWTRRLGQWLEAHDAQRVLAPWTDIVVAPEVSPAPPEPGLEQDAAEVELVIEESLTRRLLGNANDCYRTNTEELLLAGLALAGSRLDGRTTFDVELEHHGRRLLEGELDLSRTVGWFTALYPLRVALGPAVGTREAIIAVKEGLRRRRDHADTFGLLRQSRKPEVQAALAMYRTPPILFNYLGDLDKLTLDGSWSLAARSGHDHAAEGPRTHAFDVNVYVSGQRLIVRLAYPCQGAERARMQRWMEAYVGALDAIAEHCADPAHACHTPSDFPLLDLTPEQAARLRPEVEDAYPLGAMQEGMYFYSHYYPHVPMYHVHGMTTLKMDLDLALLERALYVISGEFTILRTALVSEGFDRPIQVVYKTVEHRVEFEDVSGLSPAEQDQHRTEHLKALSRRGFDLARPPLICFKVLKKADDLYQLVEFFHHTLLDGWSNAIVFTRLMEVYTQLRRGESPRLARPASTYRDFVAFQMRQKEQRESEEFWRRQVDGVVVNEIPLDAPRGEERERRFRTEMRFFNLGPDRTARLRQATRRLECTISELLVTAHFGLLGLLVEDDDLTIGYSVVARPAELPDIDAVPGMFINAVPLRLRVPPGTRAGALLAAVRALLLEAREHEAYPLTEILRLHRESGGRARRTLFNTMFTAENYPRAHLPEGVIGIDGNNWHMTEFDLAIVWAGETEGVAQWQPAGVKEGTEWSQREGAAPEVGVGDVHFKFAYASDVLRPATIEGWFNLYRDVLDAVCATPDEPLEAVLARRVLATTAEAEARTLPLPASLPALIPAASHAPATFAERFAAQVTAAPDAPALTHPGGTLSYAQLDLASLRLVHALQRAGVGPDERVLVAGPAGSPVNVTALVACLRAGRAFIPVHPATPPERLARLAREARVTAVVGDESVRHAVGEAVKCHVAPPRPGEDDMRLHLAGNAPASFESMPPATGLPPLSPEVPAYIVYTSGSTGEPRGVVVRQRNLAHFLDWYQARVGFGPADRVAQLLSPGFDAALSELLPALAAGAEAWSDGALSERAPSDLLERIAAAGVSVLTLPAVYFEQLAEAVEGAALTFERLRLLVVGGDVLRADAANAWQRACAGRVPLLNVYGLAEATIGSSAFLFDGSADHLPGWSVPVGEAGAEPDLLVIGNAFKPCAPGEEGEIFLRGGGIAAGYLGDGAAAPARFLPGPVPLLRTADRARVHMNGAIEVLGRRDREVKVRGQRVDLTALERAVQGVPGVLRAAAGRVPEPALRVEGRLRVAYTADASVDPAAVVTALAAALPAPGLPVDVVRVPALPLGANGKPDVTRLSPDAAVPIAYAVAPSDGVLERLRGIWSEVLGKAEIPDDAGFADLGGDSLLAVTLAERVRAAFRVPSPLSALVAGVSIGQMAENLARVAKPARDGRRPR